MTLVLSTRSTASKLSILARRKAFSDAGTNFVLQIRKGFHGKVAVITGASSGIGAGTAEELAARGCSLALVGRNEANLQEVKKKCVEMGLSEAKIFPVIADLSKETETRNVIDQTVKKFGKLNILVNSAGILTTGSIETLTLDMYDEAMNLNVRSMLILIQQAVPHLIASKGNIVNVSSVTGVRAFPNVLAYCIAKAATDQMTRCIALELAPKSVRVNSVNPGVIVTQLHTRAGMDNEQYEKFLEHSRTTHALGRPGMVEEVAKTITFLASDDASFITGQTLCVDGGRSVMCPR